MGNKHSGRIESPVNFKEKRKATKIKMRPANYPSSEKGTRFLFHTNMMLTITENAYFYDWDADKWIDVHIYVSAGVFSIQKYERKDIVPYQGKKVWLPYKNWFRATFQKPVLCLPEKFQLNRQDKIITIDLGQPFEESYQIRFQNDVDLKNIKTLWSKTEPGTFFGR